MEAPGYKRRKNNLAPVAAGNLTDNEWLSYREALVSASLIPTLRVLYERLESLAPEGAERNKL